MRGRLGGAVVEDVANAGFTRGPVEWPARTNTGAGKYQVGTLAGIPPVLEIGLMSRRQKEPHQRTLGRTKVLSCFRLPPQKGRFAAVSVEPPTRTEPCPNARPVGLECLAIR